MSQIRNDGPLRQREPRMRDKAYCAWIARLPCIACMTEGRRQSGVHVAHLRVASAENGKRPTGAAEKPSDKPWTLPLCPPHHVGDASKRISGQHEQGELAFYETLGLDPFTLCLALSEAYDLGKTGREVVEKFAASARRTCAGRKLAP